MTALVASIITAVITFLLTAAATYVTTRRNLQVEYDSDLRKHRIESYKALWAQRLMTPPRSRARATPIDNRMVSCISMSGRY
jgi:hypothetical protein